MSQRNVELLIGRLLTDEETRRQFMLTPGGAIEEFCRQGWSSVTGRSRRWPRPTPACGRSSRRASRPG